MRFRIALVALSVPVLLGAQPFDSRGLAQGDQQLPRFRAGANLVRVDAYVSKGGVALANLKAEDFTVYEDDKPQQIESFQLVNARRGDGQTTTPDVTNTRDMKQQTEDASRLFTIFLDRFFVQVEGSYRAQKPITDLFDKVIGPDDLVGLMTPEMSPGSVTYSRRTDSIDRFLSDNWTWGERYRAKMSPEESQLTACYPGDPELVQELLARRREQQTLDALDALVSHLETLRPERKFVLVFTEGWPLYRPKDTLTRVIDNRVPTGSTPRVDPRTGGFGRSGDAQGGAPDSNSSLEACDRMRTMLAYIDHEVTFRQLLQRANRANVSFYPVDARGLIAFDTPVSNMLPPAVDNAWLNKRYDDLRLMAEQTDGQAVLNAAEVSKSLQKVLADTGSYYLLGYYSTNQKLDGRFRRIRVEVKGEGVDVRARPGYLAPTEAEARAAGVSINRPGAKPAPPLLVTRALDSITPARGNLPIRVQAVGMRDAIRAVVELDPATAKQPEWSGGGTLRVTFEPERAPATSAPVSAHTVTVALDPGQRSIIVNGADHPLPPGRYSVRAELTAKGGRLPIQVTTFATVPPDSEDVGTGALALRRGPSTGLAYVPTADSRYRRTERLRLEVPLATEGFTGAGRLLTRDGQATPLVVSFTTRKDEKTNEQFGVADVTLAPLAEAEYVLELSLTKDGKTEAISYGFIVIP